MPSISDALTNFALRAAQALLSTIAALLAFIVLRRCYRNWHFSKLDAVGFAFRHQWDDLLSLRIPATSWRWNKFKRVVVERIALDRFGTASESESTKIQQFIRSSALLERRGFAVGDVHGHSLLRIRFRHSHLHRRRLARRNDLSALQPRTARCQTDPLLLSGAFSLPPIKHALAASRDVAICSRRYGMERDEAHRYPALSFTVTSRSVR